MPLPKTLHSYPPSMLDALKRVQETGELIIPTPNPKAMRLQFQGLRGALRANNQAELSDTVSFLIQKDPPAFILRLKVLSPMMGDLDAALAANPSPENENGENLETKSAKTLAEESLARILNF